MTDLYNLNRFLEAQAINYDEALFELKQGKKQTHWMWYVFPQLEGLGFSATSRRYSIKSLAEARAYLSHPVLGQRLRECVEAILLIDGKTAYEIMGSPDDKKLQSCMTLFAQISTTSSIFNQTIEQFFDGCFDNKTLELLGLLSEGDRLSF